MFFPDPKYNFKFFTNDKVRFYTCNNKVFTNKFLAIDEHRVSKQAITYTSNPLYQNIDCSIEPEKSWEQILIEQALLCRDSFKTVRLWYSGGIDSDLVLDTFIFNNIKLDEIHINHQAVPGANYEQMQAVAKLNSIKHLMPDTKVVFHNETTDQLKKNLPRDNWTFTGTDFPDRSFRQTRNPLGNEELSLDTIDLYGIAKPTILYIKGEWFVYMLDSNNVSDTIWAIHGHKHCFYLDYPEAHIKQAHMLRRFMENSDVPKENWNKILLGYGDENQQRMINEGSGRLTYTNYFIPKMIINVNKNEFFGRNGDFHFMNNKDRRSFEIAARNDELWKYYEIFVHNCDLMASQYGDWCNRGRFEYEPIGIWDRFWSLERNVSFTVDEMFPNGYSDSLVLDPNLNQAPTDD